MAVIELSAGSAKLTHGCYMEKVVGASSGSMCKDQLT